MNYPQNVLKIINILNSAGYEAYAVGGCVRDSIMGRTPHDWDITTSANPYEVKALFNHTVDTGLQHGTVTVMLDHIGYEVTTYRIDGEYEDSRHPKEVVFTADLREDLRRRDFTINAMAANPRDGIVDLFSGQKDLQSEIIRAVGNPVERFTEDALRILRAFRFSAQLGFTIEPETFNGATELAPTLSKVSAERIREELNKLLLSKHPEKLLDAKRAGVTAVVFPEIDTLTNRKQLMEEVLDVGNGLRKQDAIAADYAYTAVFEEKQKSILKWAVIFSKYAMSKECKDLSYDEKRDKIRTALNRYKFDNETRDTVLSLSLKADRGLPKVNSFSGDGADREGAMKDNMSSLLIKMRQLMYEVSPEIFDLYMELQRVLMCTHGDMAAKAGWQMSYGAFLGIVAHKNPVSVKDLAVNGRDLIQLGMAQGAKVGEMLSLLLQNVLIDPSLNERDKLLDLAKKAQF